MSDKLLLFLYGIIVFVITRQIPFSNLSSLGSIALLIVPVISIFKKERIKSKHFLFLIWSFCLYFYSIIFLENDFVLATRFFLIINLILVAYFVELPYGIIKIFFFFISIQSVLLIISELLLMFFISSVEANQIRHFFILQEWGDIYSFNKFFYKIQIKGNALIPFGFFLTFYKNIKVKNILIYRLVFFLAIIVSGNFAFIISVFFFITYVYINNRRPIIFHLRLILLFFLIGFLFFPAKKYITDQLKMKEDVSLSVRYDQVEVLIDNMTENPFDLIFGKGLGNTVPARTIYRDYTGDIYYELQTVYFFNQLGLVGLTIFFFLNYIFVINSMKLKKTKIIYLSYIIYAFTNPYMLDTNHVIVILTLVTIDKYIRNENRLHSCSL